MLLDHIFILAMLVYVCFAIALFFLHGYEMNAQNFPLCGRSEESINPT